MDRPELTLNELCIDCTDPTALGQWWASTMGWRHELHSDGEVSVYPADGSAKWLFLQVPERKTLKNRLHWDFTPDDHDAAVAWFLDCGADRVNIGQSADVSWVVLADPEGNEFCVLSSRVAPH